MKLFYKLTVLITIVFPLVFSCTEDKEKHNHEPIADYTYTDEIDRIEFHNGSSDPDGDALIYRWNSDWDAVVFDDPYAENPVFYLFELAEPRQANIELTVSDGDLSDIISKGITIPKTTVERLYGLGREYTDGESNNTGYYWYIDQMNTGLHAYNNCGPASVTMAIKWVNESFDKTAEDARNTYRSDGGWWYTNDIINYLNMYAINNKTISLPHVDSLQYEIHSGHIAILCLDMFYIRKEQNVRWHVDKFYSAEEEGWGHFIVIKGYKVVDGEIFYESYDPYSFGKKYLNDTLKGLDRYYRSEDLNNAVINWWAYAIIVSRSSMKNTGGVNPGTIKHKPGL
ncbi:MAG: hypothetical protein JW973_17130 [Bacteroidales bacterium]|nr:hypothetical protein [Bacteroidales bacterium]